VKELQSGEVGINWDKLRKVETGNKDYDNFTGHLIVLSFDQSFTNSKRFPSNGIFEKKSE
jgi:hypothetical protein